MCKYLEIIKGLKKWQDIPYTWKGKVNIIKCRCLQKSIYKFIAVLSKIPTAF